MKRRTYMLWEVFDTAGGDDFLWWGGSKHGWVRRDETSAPVLQSCSMHDTRRAAERSGHRLALRGGKPILVQTCSRVSKRHPKGWSRDWGMR